ncbi:E3 ubiquitin protein ligase RNF170-like protein isoform X1 [Tanacetum coccineum]
MIRNPNFHIQVRKRKWKTVLFLLRKRKRKSDVSENPNFLHHNHHQEEEEEDVYFDAGEGDKIEEEFENENLSLGNDNESLKSDELSLGKDAALVVVSKEERRDKPPDDDCCPICFDIFTIACKTNCGHWTALQKCNCPICARPISKLTPEASLLIMREVEVVEVLKNVQRYNRLFQGGVNGVIRKFFEVPNVFKRMLCGLMDPDRFRGNYYAMRSFALLMSCMYNISSFDFIPTGMYLHLQLVANDAVSRWDVRGEEVVRSLCYSSSGDSVFGWRLPQIIAQKTC